MTRPARSFALAMATAALLSACGSGSGPSPSREPFTSGSNGGSGTTGGSSGSFGSSGSSGSASNAADVDVCSLLSQTDAAEVARANGLNGAQTAATVYTLTATEEPDSGVQPASSCKFTIDGQGASGTVVILVTSAEHFDLYASGNKVEGLGDEAYSNTGTTVVRVGELMLSAGENSFTDGFVVDLYRKMIPNLK